MSSNIEEETEDPNATRFNCDWRGALNMNPAKQGSFGYLKYWVGCGGLALKDDIKVWNPLSHAKGLEEHGATIECVGAIERFEHFGGETDPIRIVAYVSRTNAASLRAKLASPMSNTALQVRWYIVSFDEEKKQWYEAAAIKNEANVEAQLDSMDGELQLFSERGGTKLGENIDVKLFRVEFQIVPSPDSSSELVFAFGPSTRLVFRWGGG